MHLRLVFSLVVLSATVSPAMAEQRFPATLAGHAFIPAATFVAAPADAPADAQMPGKFTGAVRNEVAESVMGDTGGQHGK
jgi:hypothetical protein